MRIQAINFLSWKNLDFGVESGVTLIDGWNEDDQTSEGSGKSAILNAYSWACYGKLPKDVKIDEVIKRGEKSCAVSILFDDGISIVRSRKPNDLVLNKNGEQIRGKDAKETQQIIEEYLGLTFDTFCQTIYFAQNFDKKFITSNQEDKGKILSEIQEIKDFDKARDLAHAAAKSLDSELGALNQQAMSVSHQQELTLRDRNHAVQLYANNVNSKNENIARVTQDLGKIQAMVTDVETKIQDFQQVKVSLEAKMNDLNLQSEDKSKVYAELSAEISSINMEINYYESRSKSRISKNAQAEMVAERYRKLDTEKKELNNFIVNPTKDCPTCGSTLEGCDTTHARSRVSEINKELDNSRELLQSISEELVIPLEDPVALKSKIVDLQNKQSVIKSEIMAITAELSTAKGTLWEEHSLKANHQVYVNQYNESLKSIEYLKNIVIPEPNTAEFDAKLDSFKNQLLEINKKVSDINKKSAQYTALKDGFREVKSYIFNSVLAEINMRTNEYLAKLFEVPCEIRFTNDNMKIETSIIISGEETSLGLLSGGQFRRVSLATDLALSDITLTRKNSKANLIILDEYFKDLSESSMEKCLALLQERKSPVLLIEHNSVFKSIVDKTFMVRLEDGTSEQVSYGA